jgi:hypothetical protein
MMNFCEESYISGFWESIIWLLSLDIFRNNSKEQLPHFSSNTYFLPFLITTTSTFLTTKLLFHTDQHGYEKINYHVSFHIHVNLEDFGTCYKKNCWLWLVIWLPIWVVCFLYLTTRQEDMNDTTWQNTLSWIEQGKAKECQKMLLPFESHTDSSATFVLHLFLHSWKFVSATLWFLSCCHSLQVCCLAAIYTHM